MWPCGPGDEGVRVTSGPPRAVKHVAGRTSAPELGEGPESGLGTLNHPGLIKYMASWAISQ